MAIDGDTLREYLKDYVDTVVFSGVPIAVTDLVDIERMCDEDLCRKALELGIDISRFAV